jgi:hypothetical protein
MQNLRCRFSLAALWTALQAVALAVTLVSPAGAQQFSDWSEPVSLGATVNSTSDDAGAFITRDGLSLYFNSSRPGGFGGLDIYVSRRSSVEEPWGPPVNLGLTVNSSFNEQTSAISPDGHRLYFASDRPGGFGGLDLYVSRRHDKRDDFGWRSPVNLGAGVNSLEPELGPAIFNQEEAETETVILYFGRGGVGARDIYVSTLGADGSFGPAVPVAELSGAFDDARPSIRRDGLEMFFDSNRPGTVGLLDIWVSTRARTSDPWSAPVNVTSLNSAALDARPSLSFDGRSLYFHSGRAGGLGGNDIYVSTRTKLP